MSWKSYAREVERAQRRAEQRQAAYQRAAAKDQREHEKEWKATQKAAAAYQKELAKLAAASEVAQYDAYVRSLQGLHKRCSSRWDWEALATEPAPAQPSRASANEDWTKAELERYTPSFLDKLFGKDKKHRAKLEASIPYCRQKDDEIYQLALTQWQEAFTTWQKYRNVGQRILERDQAAYPEALELTGAFDEVAQYGTVVKSGAAKPDAILLTAEITDDEVVPTEGVKLLASGKLSTKAMPSGQYWELYQDHVCSCALRLGCEVFAALPVEKAIINIGKSELNSATGHPELVTFLAIHFTRQQLASINLKAIDPSNSMTNFSHRMTFKKTKGFHPVDPITFEDQFVTT